MASFTSSLYENSFHLVTYKTTASTSVLSYVARPFQPFTTEVWGFIILVLLYVAVGQHICDLGGVELEHKHGEVDRGRRSMVYAHAAALGKTMYQTGLGYVSGGPVGEMGTSPARLINIGLGLFIIFSITLFQAKLTTNLVTIAHAGEIRSIEMAIEREQMTCMLESVTPTLVAKYPGLMHLAVPCTDGADALQKMDVGLCSLAILQDDAWANAQTRGTAHCNKTKAGETLASMQNAMPIRQDLQQPLSWAISTHLHEGWYIEEQLVARFRYMKPDQCTPLAEESRRLGMEYMGGPMVFSVACTTAGIISALIKSGCRKTHAVTTKAVERRRSSRENAATSTPSRPDRAPSYDPDPGDMTNDADTATGRPVKFGEGIGIEMEEPHPHWVGSSNISRQGAR
jgi:hypothetical protein